GVARRAVEDQAAWVRRGPSANRPAAAQDAVGRQDLRAGRRPARADDADPCAYSLAGAAWAQRVGARSRRDHREGAPPVVMPVARALGRIRPGAPARIGPALPPVSDRRSRPYRTGAPARIGPALPPVSDRRSRPYRTGAPARIGRALPPVFAPNPSRTGTRCHRRAARRDHPHSTQAGTGSAASRTIRPGARSG